MRLEAWQGCSIRGTISLRAQLSDLLRFFPKNRPDLIGLRGSELPSLGQLLHALFDICPARVAIGFLLQGRSRKTGGEKH